MTKLTALDAKRASYPSDKKGLYMLPDGDGLYLQFSDTGRQSWVYRYTLRGKARVMGLGRYVLKVGDVSLPLHETPQGRLGAS